MISSWIAKVMNPLLVFLFAAGLLAITGCDTNARFNPNRISFDELRPISAYPAALKNDAWRAQCGGGDVDGLLFNMVLTSTVRKTNPNSTQDLDRDRSVRPGDVINTAEIDGAKSRDARLSGTGAFDIAIDCMDPLPDADGSVSCQGATAAPQMGSVRYQSFSANRREGSNVLILVDMSGSMKGLVDKDTNREYAPTQQGVQIPTDLTVVASDYHLTRLSLVREFVDSLNQEDKYGIVAFGEGLGGAFMKTACTMDGVAESWDSLLQACFGIPTTLYWDQGIDALSKETDPGRSNLWDAVTKGYTFLRDKADLQHANHLVVITDGPDTCVPSEDFADCQTPCTSVQHTQVLDMITQDKENPNAAKVHIHFVQFESKGYPGSDARQVEVACESTGHYQFINSNTVSSGTFNAQAFNDALKTAMFNVRFSLMGFWQAPLMVQSFSSNAAGQGTPRGYLYALSGKITLKSETNLVSSDDAYLFTSAGAGSWDARPRLRKACTAKTDCGAGPDADTNCTTICSESTMLCPNADSGVRLPNGVSCADNSGGVCCDGTCTGVGEVCPACD